MKNGIYHVVKTMLFKKRKLNSAHCKRQYPELAQVWFEARVLVRVCIFNFNGGLYGNNH